MDVPKDFVKFTGKRLYWSLFFSKISDLAHNFITKETPVQMRIF